MNRLWNNPGLVRLRPLQAKSLIALVLVTLGISLVSCGSSELDDQGGVYNLNKDSKPPVMQSITIHEGLDQTPTTDIAVMLEAEDDKGVVGYYLAEDPVAPKSIDGGWEVVESTRNLRVEARHHLSEPLGKKTLYAWFKDEVGNISNATSDSIQLVDPEDYPGIYRSDISGDIDEDGVQATFEVWITSKPAAKVRLSLAVSKPEQVDVSPDSLVFSPGDWEEKRIVTLSAVKDMSTDGDQKVVVRFGPTRSNDPYYDGLELEKLKFIVGDDSPPEVVSVDPPDGALQILPNSPVRVLFSEAIDPETVTVNTLNDDCWGTIQLSNDDFTSCVPMLEEPSADVGQKSFWVVPALYLEGLDSYQIKVTEEITDLGGKTMLEGYLTAKGFRIYALHDTGQSQCFDEKGNLIDCPSAGDPMAQDGSYQGNQLSFTDNDDGTLTDEVTGLMWAKEAAPESGWNETVAYCEDLELAGHQDWRMPRITELVGILHFGMEGSALQHSGFSVSSLYYWSMETRWDDPDLAHAISNSGKTKFLLKQGSFYTNSTLCVRGTEPSQTEETEIFKEYDQATLLDLRTGLVWQREANAPMDWKEALAHCEGLDLAERSDWRLPNAKELYSLLDFRLNQYPLFDPDWLGLPTSAGELLLTSTSSMESRSQVVTIDLTKGSASSHNKMSKDDQESPEDNSRRFLCVTGP